MVFTYTRVVHFRDTDAAGVVYFANLLAMCHEAYETSLADSGLDLKAFFAGREMAVPITHATIDFFHPLACGDRLAIQLIPQSISSTEFEVAYQVFLQGRNRPAAQVRTRHVCIEVATRTRRALTTDLAQWLQRWNGELPQ